jgi:Bacterial PH domain
VSEYDCEPVPGLPENLPDGETIIWQGAPDRNGIARRVLQSHVIAGYFAILALVPFVSKAMSGGALNEAAMISLRVVVVGALAYGIVRVLAQAISKTTLYTITSKRVVMRYGVAFPISLNIPFNEISAVNIKQYSDGRSDVALTTSGALRLSYLHLWPHARSWKFDGAQPTLRTLEEGEAVAEILANAMLSAGVVGTKSKARTSSGLQTSLQHSPQSASAAA